MLALVGSWWWGMEGFLLISDRDHVGIKDFLRMVVFTQRSGFCLISKGFCHKRRHWHSSSLETHLMLLKQNYLSIIATIRCDVSSYTPGAFFVHHSIFREKSMGHIYALCLKRPLNIVWKRGQEGERAALDEGLRIIMVDSTVIFKTYRRS